MNDDEKDKLISQIIATDAGRKWLVKLAEDNGTLDKLGEAIIASVNEMSNAYRKATEENHKRQEMQNCSWCQNRGWWHNEFLDEVY